MRSNGYEAYHVNSLTHDAVESELGTDLDELGIKDGYSYIVAAYGDGTNSTTEASPNSYGTPTSEFTHVYKGITYRMRYLIVTGADDPLYAKATSVNLLNSKVLSLIHRCIDAAIVAYIGVFSKTLATIASLTGLSIADFGTAQSTILHLFGATAWTRVYSSLE